MRGILIAASIAVLAGCAPSKGILLPQADGNYASRYTSSSRDSSLTPTLRTAEETCGKQGKRFAIIDQATKYTGQMGTEDARDFVDGFNSATAARKGTSYWKPIDPNAYTSAIIFKCVE